MSNKMPFIARFVSKRPSAKDTPGLFCDSRDLRMILVGRRWVPLVSTPKSVPETKTITEARGERED